MEKWENIDHILDDRPPLIQTNFQKMEVICICKGCPNLKYCLDYMDKKPYKEDNSNYPQNFSCPSGNSNISTNRSNDTIKFTFVKSFLRRFIGYFTKRNKKDTQREESNDDIINSHKRTLQSEYSNLVKEL